MNNKQSYQLYLNTLPEHKSISSDKLVSGVDYQRAVRDGNVLRMLKNGFNPYKFDPPIVSLRDGRYILVDGQHRILMLQYLNGGKPVEVECRIYHTMTYEDEANLVTHHDEGHTKMSPVEHITAASKGSDDEAEIVREFMAANDECGITLTKKTNTNKGEFAAITTLLSEYRRYGKKTYCRVMRLINETWEGKEDSKRNQIITAMFEFDKRYFGKYEASTFKRRLNKKPCSQLFSTAKTMDGSQRDNLVLLIVSAYNKGTTEDKRL